MDNKLSHVMIIRFHYEKDDPRFEWRFDYFKKEVLPRILAQTNKDFDIAVWCNKIHSERFKALSSRIITFQSKSSNPIYHTAKGKAYYSDFMPWENIIGLKKYDIQSGLDSDDLIESGYVDRILHEIKKNGLDKSLHVFFCPDLVELNTQKHFPIQTHYSPPSRGSALFSIYQPNKDNYIFAYQYSHLTIGEHFDNSVMIPVGYCSMTIHGRNESTDRESMVGRWDGLPRVSFSQINNFGDKLNEVILHKYVGRYKLVPKGEKYKLLPLGSILETSQEGDMIWGTGLIYEKEYKAPEHTEILAVRGKLTRKLIKGVHVPEVYGDPALLMPLIYHPRIEKKHKVGYVPHYADKGIWKEEFIIDVQQDVFKVIDDILSCERIVSSSLHGLIIAEAYGIPAMWVKLSDKVLGKGFKFRDYASSTNRTIESGKELPPIPNLDELQQGLINAITNADLNKITDVNALGISPEEYREKRKAQAEKLKQVIEAYKIKNPIKYQQKEKELMAQLNSLL